MSSNPYRPLGSPDLGDSNHPIQPSNPTQPSTHTPILPQFYPSHVSNPPVAPQYDLVPYATVIPPPQPSSGMSMPIAPLSSSSYGQPHHQPYLAGPVPYQPYINANLNGPSYFVQTNLQHIGQPGHLPLGGWSDGIFDCINSLPICVISWLFPPIRWALTIKRLGVHSFAGAFFIYLTPFLLTIASIYAIFLVSPWFFIPFILCPILLTIIGMAYRTKIRQRYNIPGSSVEDFLLHCFCSLCAITQEARHVDRDLAFPV